MRSWYTTPSMIVMHSGLKGRRRDFALDLGGGGGVGSRTDSSSVEGSSRLGGGAETEERGAIAKRGRKRREPERKKVGEIVDEMVVKRKERVSQAPQHGTAMSADTRKFILRR